jgi:7,8-dihydropterin-6-yl-methyl-4-(beta-D-ribofuranosyl)aminobenzene 5'-phosphate synthase
MNHYCWVGMVVLFGLTTPSLQAEEPPKQITILFDAFSKSPELKKDWGFAALVEYGGKRILFDTGNNAEMFAHNLKQLKVDVASLDCVVISHRHGDHTNGLLHLLKVRPDIPLYVPFDESFGGQTPRVWYERGVESLPSHMRYFDGKAPENVPHGTAWRNAKITQVKETKELFKGVHLIATVSQVKGTLELPELSLALVTPKGLVVLTGCGHCGVEKVVEMASGLDKRVYLLAGGFHFVGRSEAEIEQVGVDLRERWKVQSVAPGHCTSEQGFRMLRKLFGDQYVYAGIGEVIPLP